MARLAALVCAASVALPGTRAASSHAGLCDAINVCDLAMFDGKCPPGMELVTPPTRSDAYALRTSDAADKSGDPTSYTPNAFIDLHLRVLEPALRYCGLLLYAVRAGEGEVDEDGNVIEQRVGSWDARIDPDNFQASPVCGEEAITHRHAAQKRLHHTFRFLAPEAGAGRLAFRLLLKYGETQGGDFYWPMTDGDLELDEAAAADDDAPAADAVWLRADVRPSDDDDDGAFFATCAERCEAAGGECDARALADATGSAEALDTALSPQLTCRAPLLMGCATGADSDANCFYEGGLDCDDDDDDESPCDVPLTRARFFGAGAAEFEDASFLCPCTGETLVVRLRAPRPDPSVARAHPPKLPACHRRTTMRSGIPPPAAERPSPRPTTTTPFWRTPPTATTTRVSTTTTPTRATRPRGCCPWGSRCRSPRGRCSRSSCAAACASAAWGGCVRDGNAASPRRWSSRAYKASAPTYKASDSLPRIRCRNPSGRRGTNPRPWLTALWCSSARARELALSEARAGAPGKCPGERARQGLVVVSVAPSISPCRL